MRIWFFIPALLMINSVLMVAGIDIYLPSLPYLVKHFETHEWVLQMSLMLSPAVSSLSGFFFGHVADKKGCRLSILWATLTFSFGSLLCALSSNIEGFLLFRVVQSFGSGGMSVLSLVILSHFFRGATFARYLATYGILFPVVFAIAPLSGAYLMTHFGWESSFYVLFGASFIFGILLFCVLLDIRKVEPRDLWPKLILLTKSKRFMALVMCHGLPIGILHLYVSHSPFIWMNGFGYSALDFAYFQIIPVGFNLIGTLIYRRLVGIIGISSCLKIGYSLSFLFCVLSLILGSHHPLVFLGLICIFSLSLVFFIVTHVTLAMESAKNFGGIAAAHINATRNLLTAGGGILAMISPSTPGCTLTSMMMLMFVLTGISIKIQRCQAV